MRTTIVIPDSVYRRIKARAAHEGRSARTLILLAVEQALATPASRGHRVTLPIVPSKKPHAMRLDNARIYDVISFP